VDRRDFLAGAVGTLGSVVAGSAEAADRLGAQASREAVELSADSRPVVRYGVAKATGPAGTGPLFARNAYLHPLRAPNGAVVTDDFPKDHPHQRGVFFAWTKTEVGDLHPDFWNLGSGTGRISTQRVSATGGGEAGFRSEHLWEMKRGDTWEAALDETWDVVLHQPRFTDSAAPDAAYVLDLTSKQTPRVDILLPAYRYGGMSVRGSAEWNRKGGPLKVLTSEGRDWAAAENTHARWADMSGPIGELHAGVAILEHPTNLRAPNLIRVPPEYPYVVYCPSKGEPLTLSAGKTYQFRYRLIIHNGPADAATLNQHWDRFKALNA